jgi:2-oxoisovalerate dehydrogenase E1 component alpha subunit
LELHIPEPPARPGDSVDFSQLDFGEAGRVRRPPVDGPQKDMRDLPYELIRVLDGEGRALGPWDPKLSPDLLRRGLRAMLLTRAFDERLFRAHRQGKTSFYLKSTGEEAIGATQSMLLRNSDMCFPTYRVLSWLMARDYPLTNLVNQIFSNEKDPA